MLPSLLYKGIITDIMERVNSNRRLLVNAPAVRLIATLSLVNVAEPRLKVKG